MPTGTTYTWTVAPNADVTGESDQATGQSNITQTLTNTSNTVQTVVYTVTPKSGSCTGATFTVTVTVNPRSTVDVINNQAVCAGSAVSAINISSTVASSTFTWSNNTTSIGLAASGSGNIASFTGLNTTNAPVTATVTVTPTYTNNTVACSGTNATFNITINPKPTIAAKTQTICSGAAFTVTPTNGTDIVPAGTTYTWTVVDNTNVTGDADQTTGQSSISQTLTNLTNTAQTVVYTVTPTSGAAGSCVGATFTVTVTVSPKASIANTTATACSGAAFTVTPANGTDIVPTGTTYSWSAPTVTGGLTGGAPGTALTNISGTLTNPTNVPQTATYTVTPTSGSCTGPTFTVIATINPKPVVPANQTATACSGSAFTFTLTNAAPTTIIPAGTTYTWTVAPNANVTGEADQTTAQSNVSQTLINTTNTAQLVVYTVTPKSGDAGACPGAAFTLTVTVNPTPVIADQTTTICSGSAFTVTPANAAPTTIVPTGTTYTWTVVPNINVTGESDQATGQSNISQTLTNTSSSTQTVTYTVTPKSGSCTGATFTVTVTVNPSPTINSLTLDAETLCLNSTPRNFSISASNADGTITNYQWYSNTTPSNSAGTAISGANSNTFAPPTSIAGTTYYYALITNSFNCTTTTVASGAITVNPLPNIISHPSLSPQTKCLNDALISISVSATAGSGTITKYEWYKNSNNNNTTGTLVDTHIVSATTDSYTPLSNTSGTYYYYAKVYNSNGCVSTSNISAPITVNDPPAISANLSGTNQVVCLNSATTDLSVTASPGSGTINSYIWYYTNNIVTPNWTIAATHYTSAFTDTYTPLSNTVGVTYYYVVVKNSNNCTIASSISGSVTVNPIAIINNQTDTRCSGSPFSKTLTTGGGIIVPSGTTYSWNAPTVTGGLTGGTSATGQTTLNGTLTNPTNQIQTATYTVIPRTGNCDGPSFTYTVTINPKATVTIPSIDICSGNSFSITPTNGTNGNIIPANTTYTWTTPIVTGGILGGSAATGQSSFSGSLTNPTNAQKTATYTVTPSSIVGPCVGDNFTVVVNVNAKPTIAAKTQTICSGDAFNITPSNAGAEIVPANTTYTWTVTDNTNVTGETNNNTPANSIGQNLINNSNTVQTIVYNVTPVSGDAGNCPGTPFNVTIYVNPKPSISAKNVSACSNELFTVPITNGVNNDIVPSGTTYTWSAPIVTGGLIGGAAGSNLTTISGNLSNPTSVAQTATYTIRPISNSSPSCTGSDFTVVATIKPKAIITAKSTAACSNDAFTFALADGTNSDVIPAGTTYTWSIPTVTGGLTGGAAGNALASIGGTLSNPSNTSQTATYSIIANSSNCISTAFAATATIYTRPFIQTQNIQTCSGTAFNVSISNGGGNILPSSTNYTWTVAQNNNVTGASDVNVATPTITQTLNNITNTDQIVTYTVTPISGVAGNCVGLPFTVNVTVKPKPNVIPQTESICSGNNFINSPANGNGNIIPAGTTYTWTSPVSNPSGAIIGGSAQASAQTQIRQLLTNNTNAPATLTYTVTPSANGCAGSSYQLIVNVNPKPVINAIPTTICSSETFTVAPVNVTNGIVPANTTYTWEVIDNPNVTGESRVTTGSNNISQTLVNTSNIAQTVVYTVTPISGDAGNCTGPIFTVTVTVNPQPSITAQQVQTVCSGTVFNIAPTNSTDGIVPTNTKYTWANPIDNPVGSITGQSAQLVAASTISQLLNNITNTPATISYSVTPIAGSCTGPNFTVVITVNPKPNINAQARTICSDDLFTVSPVNSTDGIVPNNTTYTWPIPISNPAGAVTGGSTQTVAAANISQRLTNTTNTAATLTYSVTPKSGAAGSCLGSPFNVVVNVNAKPVIGNQTREICSGSAFNLPLTNGGSTIIPANTTYTWFVSTNNNNITGQSDVNVDQSTISQTLTNNTNVAQQITYTITPKSGATGNCIGSTFLLTVTVNPKPVISTQTQTICSNSPFNISPINGGNLIVPANTTYTWTAPTSNPLGAITGGAAQLSSVASISQLLTNNSNSQGLYTYVVTPTSGAAGGCVGAPFNVEITVSPKPILTSTLTPPAICNATTFSYIPVSPTTGRSWVWTRNVVAGITNALATGTGDINETLINTTANPITVPYVFALTTYGCPNTQTVNVIVYPTPQLTSALTLSARCSGEPVYYDPTSATVGTTFTWTRAAIAGISNPAASGSGAISETLANTSPNPIVVTYVYTLLANGCTNQQTVSVTIDPLPIASFNIGGLRADCGPITRTFINNSSVNSSPLTNGTFTWGINILKNGGAVPVYSLINTNFTTQVNYTFTNTGIRDSIYPIFLTAKSPNGCINTYKDTITVHPDAHIDLTIKSEAACAPFNAINSINVVNKTDPSPEPTINLYSSYKWTIRDRNGSVLSNTVSPNPPNYEIKNPDDTLKIALKVNSLYGCRPDSVNKIVYTYENPIVNFTVAPQNSCTMLETQAVNNSYYGKTRSTSNLNYAWYANNSLKSTAPGPVTLSLINNSNTRDSIYTIKLVISENTHNCKDSSSIGNLIVYPKPKAIFTIDKGDQVCTTINGVNSSINNSSLYKTGTLPQYKWSVTYNNLFDTARAIVIDSTTLPYIAAKPNFKFRDAKGTIDTSYNINMMIYTVDGCIDTLSKTIRINRRPNVDFTVPYEGCGILNVLPVDNTINIPNDSLIRLWSVLPTGGLSIFNSTTNNPTIIFPINKTANSIAYEVKQNVANKNGCTDELKKFVTIHPKPTALFTVGKTDSCGPWTKIFINTSDPKNGLGINAITSRWEVKLNNRVELNSSTRDLTYTFTNTGVVNNVYTVILYVSNPQGCLDTIMKDITVHPNARAYFNDDTKGCAPFKIRDHIKIQDFPEANDIFKYEWRIYDRFNFLLATYTGSIESPDYTIQNESDTVTLQLIAYSKYGCTQDMFSRKIITYPNSVHANADAASTVCSGSPISFTNKSYYGNNFQTDNLQYQWFVNDVKVSNEINPTFTFKNNSNLIDSVVNVKLVVTYTNTGCDQTWSKDITVYPAPLAKFTVANVEICGNPSGFKNYITESIVAKNNSYTPVWTITNLYNNKPAALNILPTSKNKEYQLQLGDNKGNIDTVYALNLSVISINGCKADATSNISLYRRPDVNFSISNTLICGESTLQLTDQTINVPTAKVWSYTTATGSPLTFIPSATAANPKILVPPNITGNLVTYYIKQVATTVNGCKDSITVQLDAKALPTAKFSMSESTSCLETATIKFTDESIPRTPETITGWAWNFGDGSTSNLKNPSHFYSKPGTYTVSLVITNNDGCSSLPTTKTVIIYGSPKADFVMPKQICLNDNISFLNTSTLGYGNTKIISNTWDFGDGTALDYTVNPSHVYKKEGTYKVSLSVRADNSCVTSTFTADIIVIGYPTANFSITNYCVESPILFKDLSTPGYADKLGAWRWDFGDKSTSNLTNPTHIYKSTGTFPVNLIVSGSFCPSLESTITIPLKIIDRRKDSVYAIKYLQYNVAQNLCAAPGGDKYTWSPSTDINPVNSRCVNINMQHPKTIYKITIIDPAGCTITDTQEVWGFPGTDIFLPRAFIPASSIRENAIFKPIYVGVTAIKYFKIYDRFGHEVFTTSDMSKYWDGTANGKNQPMETYTWIIQGYDYNNKPIIRQGNVTLIRYQ